MNSHLLQICAILLWSSGLVWGQNAPATPQALCFQEVDKAVLNLQRSYLDTLKDALKAYQQEGDLDGYLAAQGEIKRFETAKTIKPENFVSDPAELAWQQGFYYTSQQETILGIANQHIQNLLPEQQRLTREGKIDEAIKIRAQISAIRSQYKDVYQWQAARDKAPQKTVMPAGVLIKFYGRDQIQADRLLNGKKILVEGQVVDLSTDSSNGGIFLISLQDRPGGQARLVAQVMLEDYNIRRVSGGERMTAHFDRRDSNQFEPHIVSRGDKIQLEGTIIGRHIHVNMARCRFPDSVWKPKPPTPQSP